MKKILLRYLTFTVICMLLLICLSGCDSNPVAGLEVSNEPYTDSAAIGKAPQPDELPKTSDVYASIYFIESPKGINYTVNWIMNDKVLSSEEKPMTNDKSGVLVFKLESSMLKEGTLMLEIRHKDHLLEQREIQIK